MGAPKINAQKLTYDLISSASSIFFFFYYHEAIFIEHTYKGRLALAGGPAEDGWSSRGTVGGGMIACHNRGSGDMFRWRW